MSVLEAHVASEEWDALQRSYETRARVLPPQIVESFLAQSATDPMRQSGETPTGVLIFRDAGAEPTLSIFTIRANPQGPADPAR